MPLYLVRWPGMLCSLIRAHDRPEVLDILDELGNAEGALITKYGGPVILNFELPSENAVTVRPEALANHERPLAPGDITVGDVDNIAERQLLRADIPGTGTGYQMHEAILRIAFPALARVIEDSDHDVIDKDAIRAALLKDAMVMIEASWRQTSTRRSSDPAAKLAVMMGTSPEWVRSLTNRAEEDADE